MVWVLGLKSCFNEAGAFLPRRLPISLETSPSLKPRFNEAGAFLPRRCRVGEAVAEEWRASMRPGHFYPGDFPGLGSGTFIPRCFNEAGAFLPRRSASDLMLNRLAPALQ